MGEQKPAPTENNNEVTASEVSETETSETTTELTPEQKLEAALADVEKWKHFSRKNEEASLAAQAAADKWKAHEEASLSESEKLQKRVAELEGLLSSKQRESIVTRVTKEANLPDAALEFIKGETEEEVKAEVAKLVELFGAKPAETATEPATKKPIVNPLQGKQSTGAPVGTNGLKAAVQAALASSTIQK